MFWINIRDLDPKDGMVVLGLTEDGPIVAVWRKTAHHEIYGWHPYHHLYVEYDLMLELTMYMKIPNF